MMPIMTKLVRTPVTIQMKGWLAGAMGCTVEGPVVSDAARE